MMNQNNNNQGYKPNVATYLSKYLLGAPLSEEEIIAIASLTEEQQMDLTIALTSESLKNLNDLNAITLIASEIYGQISLNNQNIGYNIDPNIKKITFDLNTQKISLQRAKQKGNSR